MGVVEGRGEGRKDWRGKKKDGKKNRMRNKTLRGKQQQLN